MCSLTAISLSPSASPTAIVYNMVLHAALNQCDEQFLQAEMRQSGVGVRMQAKVVAAAQEERLKRGEEQSAMAESKLAAAEARAAQAEARLQVPALHQSQRLQSGILLLLGPLPATIRLAGALYFCYCACSSCPSKPVSSPVIAWETAAGLRSCTGILVKHSEQQYLAIYHVMGGCRVSISDRTCYGPSTHNLPALRAGFRAGEDGAVPQGPIWQRRGGVAAALLPRSRRLGRGGGTPQPLGAA